MRSLLNFIYKYHYFILFILLQTVSFIFLIQHNSYQRAAFINSSSHVSGRIYNTAFSVSQYFHLKETNKDLANQVSSYSNMSKSAFKENRVTLMEIHDSVLIQQYEYFPAQVINNSVNKQNNYITINKGEKHGVKQGMAVVSANGIVGIVKATSDNFASVISVLNQNLRISAMVQRNNYFGTLHWEGKGYESVTLSDLPNHISISSGDTIVTSGFSAIFPKGKLIGVIDDVGSRESGDFYDVSVKLSEDFKSLTQVFVIKNLLKAEQLELERSASHD